MSLWIMYWVLRAVDHIFLLLVILFLTWYLYPRKRNTNRLQDESDSENQTVDAETDSHSSNVNNSRGDKSKVINNIPEDDRGDPSHFVVNINLPDITFHPDYNNRNSYQFRCLSNDLENSCKEVLRKHGLTELEVKVVDAREGSTIATVVFTTYPKTNSKNLKPILEQIMESGYIGPYKVSRDHFSFCLFEDQRSYQESERMIQQFKDERDSEMAKLKQLIESKITERHRESMDKIQDQIKDMDHRIMKLETSSNSENQTKDSKSIKMQEKRCGAMLDIDYHKIRKNFMYLIENIEDPTRLSLSLCRWGVFDSEDVNKIRKLFVRTDRRNAIERLLFILLDSGRDAYQPFLKCLTEVGNDQVIERLQYPEGESNKQRSEELRLIEEREALMEWVVAKEKKLREAVKEKENVVQALQSKNELINTELDKLKNKVIKMENEKQSEKDERVQEISRLKEREDELLKKHEEVRTKQQRFLNEIRNLESRVEDFKVATISRDSELPTLQSDITNIFTLLQKSATLNTEDIMEEW
ncbi:chromosome partition protein Smc isoform X3 [Patella vulgata]|uniref:chromosome partition protein Smc isoform X3 n=1 Tax=Patella vulgata TaxID=6465 RepID=UPI0024A84C14|nr:chromosome partition protein Smc isoform X3 [Patella vulgata]